MSAAIEAAMLEAHRAGLSTLPLRSNKRPAIASWGERVDTQPDELTVRREAREAEGFAICCGGPTRLQVLDFESRFAEHTEEFQHRLNVMGLHDLFTSWLKGYFVSTPSGGFHVAVHVEGNDTPPGNQKLAMNTEGHVLVETRGHGGYVVAAPSNGNTHPSGQPWVQEWGNFEEICWATWDEWVAICSAITSFDAVAAASETPPEVPPPPVLAGGVSISRIEYTSSWIDMTHLPRMSTLLDHYGWTFVSNDGRGPLWARPGKPAEEGHSARINLIDRLHVWSTDAHPVPASRNNQTYDSADILGCYQLGHLPSQQERVEIIRQFAGLSAPHPHAVRESPALDAGWLSDDFWEARPWLSAIRSAAWAAQRCPESILGAVLSTYAVAIPSSIRLEALVGGNESPLNTYCALVGPPGAGKSGAISLARRLCGVSSSESYRYGLSLRSGEGLISYARIPQPKRKDEVPLTALYRNGIQVVFDEGNALASQNDRSGSTVLSSLCTAWSGLEGGTVGGALASGEESFPADLVRVCLILGIQYGVGSALFTGSAAAQGFPARLLYFGMDRLGERSLRRRGTPPVLDLPRHFPDARSPVLMTFPLEVEDEVSLWDEARQTQGVDPLDGHKMLLRMRVAGLLALMDDAAQIELDHWALAGEIEAHSLATRNRVVAAVREVSANSARAAGRSDLIRETARHDAWIEDRAVRLARYVCGGDGTPVPWRAIKDRFNAADRKQLPQIVEYAVERSWVQLAVGGGARAYLPGERRPS